MRYFSRSLRAFEGKSTEGLLNVIVETPKGQRNKFKFEPSAGCFSLGKVLPVGAVFPFDFGFVPGTQAEDGDPLDALLLTDEGTFPGCLVKARLIGILEAEQTDSSGSCVRNDRLLTVADVARDYTHIRTPTDLDPHLLSEYEHFFKSYHAMNDVRFKVRGLGGPRKALKLIKIAIKKAKRSRTARKS